MGQKCEKVHVLEICPGDFRTGGTAGLVWRLYQNMDKNKLQIDFFCYGQPENCCLEEIAKNGGNCWVRKAIDNKLFRRFSAHSDVHKIVKNFRYDCVHIHFSDAATEYPLFLATRRYVKKVLCHSHNSDVTAGMIRYTAHKLYKDRLCGTKIIPLACSTAAAKWLFPTSVIEKGQYTVIKNGIDAPRFIFDTGVRASVRKRIKLENRFVVGHVGRFAYQKNHEFLIDIFAEIKNHCADAVLLLVGEDFGENLIDRIKAKVDSLGLAESVIFYGSTERVDELYQAMDCFVFPSLFEGLGIVVIEAQAAGLRTLCSETVPREARITDLFEYMPLAAGPEKWAEKVLAYNNGYERKNMLQEIAKAGYDIKTSAQQLEQIYLGCR